MKAGTSSRSWHSLVSGIHLLITICGCNSEKSEKQSTSAANVEKARTTPPFRAGAEPMDRMEWNLQTLVGSYLESGHRDPSWDESATNALAKFALIRSFKDSTETDRELLVSYCRESVLKGCQDTMIHYLYTRYIIGYQENATDQLMADGYRKAISSLRKYPCALIRQTYLALRTSESIDAATTGKASAPDVHKYRYISLQTLLKALEDPGIPVEEAYEACRDLLAAVEKNPKQHPEFFGKLEPVLLAKWPNEALVQQLKGRFHIDAAWKSRGNGLSDSVSEDGWKGFKEHLDLAAAALEKGWKLDPKNVGIPFEMLSVELGQGQGRERMELWFQRAMALNTNGAAICKRKLNYLEPKWYGSPADMLAFARECAASDTWGGEVLLMPLHAHRSLAGYAKRDGNTNYWKNPKIWREIKGALDRYYERYPTDVSWRHNYAWHAYQAEDWNEFNKQLTLFTTGTNYQYFGGQQAFERMVENGRQRAHGPP